MRTFEKRAHLRRRVRTFESQGSALDPVPLARKVAQPLDSASIALFEKDFRGATPTALREGIREFRAAKMWIERRLAYYEGGCPRLSSFLGTILSLSDPKQAESRGHLPSLRSFGGRIPGQAHGLAWACPRT